MAARDDQRRTIALSAAAIYAGAAVIGVVEAIVPGGQEVSVAPGFAAVVIAPLVALFGPRMPRNALAALGLVGTVLIAVALATTSGYGDGAVLYLWPVLWMAYFFGTPGAAVIIRLDRRRATAWHCSGCRPASAASTAGSTSS